MSQGNDFANYASSVEDRSSASEDVWFVAVSSDDIKQMSVDQLDEAFRLGVITAQTAVWTEGMEAWAPLGEVADLDSDGENSAESEAAPEAPFGASAPDSSDNLPSTRRTNPGWHNPFEANPFEANPFEANPFEAPQADASSMQHSSMQNSARDSLQSSSPSYSMGPSSFAPVTASYAPSTAGSLNQSTGPVALNVDEDMPPVNRGRRFRPERWLLAAAGIAAVAVVAFNNKDLFSSASSTVAAAEKQTAAAALVARPYDLGVDKSAASAKREPAAAAAKSADDDQDAPIGSLKGEASEEETTAEAEPAAKAGSIASKEAVASKEAIRGGFAKAFSKDAPAAKPAKAAKAAKPAKQAKLARKAPPRAAAGKPKKPGVARAASAFDPLNGSLP